MGCAFSSNRVQRIFKRKKVSRAHKYIISTPPKVDCSPKRNRHCAKPSEKPATPNSYTAWYEPDVAPSLLAWLIGAKDCLEDSIPELAVTNKQESKKSDVVLPPCLCYEGYHEYGYHLFTLNSELLNDSVQDMSLDCITEAIASVLGETNAKFVLVYKNNENQTTYLPNPPAWGIDVLNKICSRFGEQVLRVLLYQPSWYIQVILEEKAANTCLSLSEAVTKKLQVTRDFKELAKLTGFPGEIKMTH